MKLIQGVCQCPIPPPYNSHTREGPWYYTMAPTLGAQGGGMVNYKAAEFKAKLKRQAQQAAGTRACARCAARCGGMSRMRLVVDRSRSRSRSWQGGCAPDDPRTKGPPPPPSSSLLCTSCSSVRRQLVRSRLVCSRQSSQSSTTHL